MKSFFVTRSKESSAGATFATVGGDGDGGVALESRSGRTELTVAFLLVSIPRVRLLLVLRREGEGIGSMGLFLCVIKYGGRPPNRRDEDLVLRRPLRSSLSVEPSVEGLAI